MIPAPESRCLGEYQLKQWLTEDERICTWLAEQKSVAREVLVDELRTDCIEQKQAFLADVRAKAAVDHPMIGSVYEAVDSPEHCFSVRELLRGESLGKIIRSQNTRLPSELAPMLCQIAAAQQHLETLGHACSPLDLENIYPMHTAWCAWTIWPSLELVLPMRQRATFPDSVTRLFRWWLRTSPAPPGHSRCSHGCAVRS